MGIISLDLDWSFYCTASNEFVTTQCISTVSVSFYSSFSHFLIFFEDFILDCLHRFGWVGNHCWFKVLSDIECDNGLYKYISVGLNNYHHHASPANESPVCVSKWIPAIFIPSFQFKQNPYPQNYHNIVLVCSSHENKMSGVLMPVLMVFHFNIKSCWQKMKQFGNLGILFSNHWIIVMHVKEHCALCLVDFNDDNLTADSINYSDFHSLQSLSTYCNTATLIGWEMLIRTPTCQSLEDEVNIKFGIWTANNEQFFQGLFSALNWRSPFYKANMSMSVLGSMA